MFFDLAKKRKVAVLARVPLASGLLTGKMSSESKFTDDDHRNYNRKGQSFDVGETFSGIDFDTGLIAVEEIKTLLPKGMTMAQFALRWTLMFDAVTLAIPGAKNSKQAAENAGASDLPPISSDTMDQLDFIYKRLIKEKVHQRW